MYTKFHIISIVCSLVLKAADEQINPKKRTYFAVFKTSKLSSMKTIFFEKIVKLKYSSIPKEKA